MKNDVLRTAVELKILVLFIIRKNHKIIRHYSESFLCESILGEHAFLLRSCSQSCVKKINSFIECNADNAGPSREWRPEGAPTTDKALHVLLETQRFSIVVSGVVLSDLQKKISK